MAREKEWKESMLPAYLDDDMLEIYDSDPRIGTILSKEPDNWMALSLL